MRLTHAFINPKADGGDATIARPSDWNAVHKAALGVSVQSGSYSIVDADNGKVIRATGSSAQTFTLPDPTSLVADWAVWIENRNTGVDAAAELIIDPNGTDTIDGLSAGAPIYTWPGDLRIVYRTGATTWASVLVRGGMIEVRSTSGATLHWPSGAAVVEPFVWGAGGSGSNGERGATGTARYAGPGGGGGALAPVRAIPGGALAASTALTATCGVGGASVAGRTTDGAQASGNAGGNSSLAASGLRTIYGFGGAGGTGSSLAGGGGGGAMGAGSANNGGHSGAQTSTVVMHDFGGGAGGTTNGANASSSIMGGGGGGEMTSAGGAGLAGGRSLFAGPGGGGGGSLTSGSATSSGGTGGAPGQVSSYSQTAGGAAGGGGGTTGTAGTDGSATPSPEGPGVGGGGGGSGTTGNGGNGGAGGRCAGGGGGGATNSGTKSGDGGAGGDGLIRISYR